MPSGNIFRNLLKGYFIPMVSVIVKRDIVRQVGDSFSTTFLLIPDLELFTNIAYKHKIKYIDKVLCQVRKHSNSLTNRNFKLFPSETKIYVNQLRNRIENFDNQYKNEIEYLNNTLQYQYSLSYWMDGNKTKAKRELKKILRSRKKYVIVYLFMFFSYTFFEKTMKFFKIGNY